MDEENIRDMEKVKISKVHRFLINEYWKNIGCLILAPTVGIGVYILWEKGE